MIPAWLADLWSRLYAKPDVPPQVTDGWLTSTRRIALHPSWYGGNIAGPGGVVCHVTDTDAGTAVNMAKRRARPFVRGKDRLSSWHVTVETDGTVIQMIPFSRVAWHAGSNTATPVPGLGWANYTCVGIELVGRVAGPFPRAQVDSYARVLRALVQAYGIRREHAMIQHSELDPGRRSDPGAVWMREHAEAVLDYAYA